MNIKILLSLRNKAEKEKKAKLFHPIFQPRFSTILYTCVISINFNDRLGNK